MAISRVNRSVFQMGALIIIAALAAFGCVGASQAPEPAQQGTDIAAISAAVDLSVKNAVTEAMQSAPPSITSEEVQAMIVDSMAGIESASSLPAEEIQGIVREALSEIEVPEAVTAQEVRAIVQQSIDGMDEPNSLSAEDVREIVQNSIVKLGNRDNTYG